MSVLHRHLELYWVFHYGALIGHLHKALGLVVVLIVPLADRSVTSFVPSILMNREEVTGLVIGMSHH